MNHKTLKCFFVVYPVTFNSFGMLFAYCFTNHPADMHVHIMIEMMGGRQVTVVDGVAWIAQAADALTVCKMIIQGTSFVFGKKWCNIPCGKVSTVLPITCDEPWHRTDRGPMGCKPIHQCRDSIHDPSEPYWNFNAKSNRFVIFGFVIDWKRRLLPAVQIISRVIAEENGHRFRIGSAVQCGPVPSHEIHCIAHRQFGIRFQDLGLVGGMLTYQTRPDILVVDLFEPEMEYVPNMLNG